LTDETDQQSAKTGGETARKCSEVPSESKKRSKKLCQSAGRWAEIEGK
jgi:hypothetical protein